ncbi:MAG: DNA gyrase/topoisomerase IV subunit A, partial [Phycisphaeraceae bacterium]
MAKRRKQTKKTRDDDAMLFEASSGDSGGGGGEMSDIPGGGESPVALHEAAQQRYLNYALSVITSRALPDVRDGLKPVQRRILYTMFQQRLTADAKHRKSAKVVGDVMGNYHPHGDQAIYDALVRLAQPWVMRERLIDGSGNFGSPDGDPPAAMRYTECRLTEIAAELIREITQDTVHFRPNYDGSKSEPVVLPARVPTLLLEGSTGIAVGMATSIPPHNLGEVCNALLKLLASPELQPYQLVANDAILGPDFPTGGQLLAARQDLRSIYENGQGTFKLRGLTEAGPTTRSTKTLYITSIPYSVNKAVLVERIAEVINARKLPPLTDVRDLSTDDTRIALELKRDADEQKVLAYLYKNTPLQVNFSVNLTALVPTENPDVGSPERLDLKSILWHFLHFRLGVVTRRLEHELRALNKRLHILEGFALVFDALDEIIAIIRKSEGKADAAEKIMARFPQESADTGEPASGGSAGGRSTRSKKIAPSPGLDAEQTDAILELKLYRLARLEINLIRDELDEKRKRRGEIEKLLAEDDTDTTTGRWRIVRDEIKEIAEKYGRTEAGKRRTLIEAAEDEPEFSAEDFIVAEDNHVLVTRDGWIKRQKEIKDPQATRLREGDAVLACEAGSTRSTFAFFSSFGVCYTARIVDLPAT